MATDPVEHVAAFLEGQGYRRLPSPLVINRMTFRLPVVLGGPEKSSDLILVADTVNAENADIVRQVQGVARALDVARASNPLTTIIVGPRPGQDDLNAIMSVCRVLPVGTVTGGDGEQHLKNWLAVLTPLNQIDTDEIVADPIATLKERIGDLPDEIAALADLAVDGEAAVEGGVNALLTKVLEGAWEDVE